MEQLSAEINLLPTPNQKSSILLDQLIKLINTLRLAMVTAGVTLFPLQHSLKTFFEREKGYIWVAYVGSNTTASQ